MQAETGAVVRLVQASNCTYVFFFRYKLLGVSVGEIMIIVRDVLPLCSFFRQADTWYQESYTYVPGTRYSRLAVLRLLCVPRYYF